MRVKYVTHKNALLQAPRPARKRGPYSEADHKRFLERVKKENYEVYLRLKDREFPTPAGIGGN
jgi:hypothetical protein